MDYSRLGQTGLMVSILGFGGIPIEHVTRSEAVEVVNRALDLGINLVHTSITYADSAYKIGEVMAERRDDCYLAVKIGGTQRTAEEATERLANTLEALRTDHVEIAELPVNAEDFPRAMGPGGAYEGLETAREEGIIDFIGITSHDVGFLESAVETGKFSNVITPFNYAANSARERLIDSASRLGLGVVAMKTLGKGGLPRPSHALWYVWQHDIDTAIVGMKAVSEVDQNVLAADNRRALTDDETEQLRAIAREVVASGRLSSSGAVMAGKR